MRHEDQGQGGWVMGFVADAGKLDNVMGGAAVAGVTDVVAVSATGGSGGRCSAEMTGKRLIFSKIFKVGAAEQAAGAVGHGVNPFRILGKNW
jgi:hypothetical protein